jgi:hypothetical protein
MAKLKFNRVLLITFFRPSTSTMTLQALCSAIRSQMYFSQISSWIDLLRKAFVDGDVSVKEQMPSLFSPEIMQNPRLKKNLQTMQVDLDILFRIRSYDGTSCFNEKPNVHNFPDTIISDGLAICVCLKTLPRMEKIPTLNTEKAHLNGFSCDNRIKSMVESPVASTSRHLIHDRMTTSCSEKGKHKCKEDDDEDDDTPINTPNNKSESVACAPISLENNSNLQQDLASSASSSTSSGLTHRERQLLKYKKRLMKRDKQKKKGQESDHQSPLQQQQSQIDASSSSNSDSSSTSSSNENQKSSKNYSNAADINSMEIPLYINKSSSTTNGSSNNLNNNNNNNNNSGSKAHTKSSAISINKNSNNHNNNSKHALTTLSIATQTEFNDASSNSYYTNYTLAMPKCDRCSNHLQCLNCDKVKLNNNFNQMPSSPLKLIDKLSLAQSTVDCNDIYVAESGNKADLLLQAIQRTAIAKECDATTSTTLRDNLNDNIFSNNMIHKLMIRDISANNATLSCSNVNSMCDDSCDKSNCILNNNNNNNNNYSVEISIANYDSGSKYERSDCRLCKRQKTKHVPSSHITEKGGINIGGGSATYRRTMSECMVGISPSDDEIDYRSSETTSSSSFSLANNHLDDSNINMMSDGDLKAYRRAFSEDVINQLPNEISCFDSSSDKNDDEYITIKCQHLTSCENESMSMHKLTPNVTLQQENQRDILLNKNSQRIPKINLSQVFDSFEKPQPQQQPQQQLSLSCNNDSGIGHDFSPTSDTDNVFIFNSPLKSYPPQLSIHLNNSVNKRRSRHISDRSSLSICSDEEDEIFATKSMNKVPSSTKISSLYKKFVSKTQTAFNKFSRLPLLGSIEENLLHNRFPPKSIVEGFKLLLGASGSFHPTQQTLPAQTYFYEFQGSKHMSTPYVVSIGIKTQF